MPTLSGSTRLVPVGEGGGRGGGGGGGGGGALLTIPCSAMTGGNGGGTGVKHQKQLKFTFTRNDLSVNRVWKA